MAEFTIKEISYLLNSMETPFPNYNSEQYNPRKAKRINDRQLLTNNGIYLDNNNWPSFEWLTINPL